MRKPLIQAGLAAGLGVAAAFLAVVSTALPLFVRDAAAQAGQQPAINPEDELSPSQLKQPMPAAVPEPTPKPGKRAAAAKPAPGSAPERAPPAARFRTVVECSGPFAKDSGMLALAVTYDLRNMTFTHETVQGVQVGVTVMFPKDPRRRLEVWWQNPNRTGTYLIDIAGKSVWSAPKGLRLGLTLEQLEKLNHKPFKLKGFDADGVASVADWDGGELASLPGGCKAGVNLHGQGQNRRDRVAGQGPIQFRRSRHARAQADSERDFDRVLGCCHCEERSDEAIQTFEHRPLDCFAKLVIGPATSGRTRWLAMTMLGATACASASPCSACPARCRDCARRSPFPGR